MAPPDDLGAGEDPEAAFFASESPAFCKALAIAGRAARSDCVVLLRGETGTGKTVLAQWIHDHSARAPRPFVTVNCPALAPELMISHLFGHRRGAFTGAVADASGKVQEAQGGTLFLDEVGDLGLELQARLLLFLNDGTYERLGESRQQRADVRVVAATNRPLEEEVSAGRFREDLLFRLKVIPIPLPPLRARRGDVLPLARRYLAACTAREGRGGCTFSREAERRIEAHRWPGNLRELHNAVRRALIMCAGSVVEADDLGIDEVPGGAWVLPGDRVPLETIVRAHIERVVAWAPTLEAAAQVLRIDRTTLNRKRRQYGLVRTPDGDPPDAPAPRDDDDE